jgi:hypothetical protein
MAFNERKNMTATVKDLQAELADLLKRRSGIDLVGLKLRLGETSAKQSNAVEQEIDTSERTNPDRVAIHHEWQDASTAFNLAESIVKDLDPKIRKLEYLLGAGDQAEQSAHQLAAAGKRVETAQEGLKAAQKTVEVLEAMAETERALFESKKVSATAELLSIVKGGGDASQVSVASRDKLEGYELAKTAAEGELNFAQGVVDKAAKLHTEAIEAVKSATCAGTGLSHALAFRDYVRSLAVHRLAYREANHGNFGTPNTDAAAREIEFEIENQENRK